MKLLSKTFPGLWCLLLLSGCLAGTACGQSQDEGKIRLLVRGDDMGITHATNRAIIESYQKGIQKSTEVIIPSPWFPEAVRLLINNPGLDAGVHLVLTSEWENLKWGPLTKSSSLVDSAGYFHPVIWLTDNYPESRALKLQDWKVKEVEKEFRAQIEKAVALIPQLTHLTCHMGCNDLSPEINQLVEKLAEEYNLDTEKGKIKSLGFNSRDKTAEQKIDAFLKKLRNIETGTYLFVGHPALNTPEMQSIYMKGYENVAADRQGITDLFTSPKVRKLIRKRNIELISYPDL